MLQKIKEYNVQYVVLCNLFFEEEPNESRKRGARLLDEHIKDNFVKDKQFGSYMVLRKK